MFKKIGFLKITLKKFSISLLILFVLFNLIVFLNGCRKNDLAIADTIDVQDIIESASTETENSPEITSGKEKDENDDLNLIDERLKEEFESYESDVDEFVNLTDTDKEYLLDIAYKAVDDFFSNSIETEKVDFDEKFNGINRKVFTSFDINGAKIGSVSALKDNLAESVYMAALRTCEDQRFEESLNRENVNDLMIEIIILGDEKKLDDNYEKGIHGIRIEEGSKSATYYNTVAIEGNHDLNTLLEKLSLKAGLEEDGYKDINAGVYYFPTLHFAKTIYSENAITFYRCNVINFKPAISKEPIKKALDLAEGWLLLNIDEDGMFNYEYETYIEKYPSTNNELRQLLSSIWLAKKSAEDSNLLQLHRINLDFIFRNWYEENGDLGYIYFQEKSKIGSIGMALRLIVASPCFEEYKDKALNLANTILALQNEDGSLKPWYIEPEYSFDEQDLLYFYSGQAILSLIELYEKTGDDRYLDAAILSQDYYINEYVTNIDTNYYPGYVPWHTMSLYKLYTATKSDKYADAIFIMNDKLIEMQNHDGRPYMDLLGQFYDPVHPEYGVPFSGSTGVDLDGLINAYKIAAVRNDYERMYEYKKAIFLGAHNLINLQFKGADMYYLSHPERVWGAIRFNADDNRIRVDATQHMADAFIGIMETFFNQ